MEFVLVPFRDEAQLAGIERMLREQDPFVIASFEPPTSNYELSDYLAHRARGGEPFAALLDRNLVTRVVRVASGRPLQPGNATDRLAMAVMAFLRAADIQIEPNLALYELAGTAGGMEASQDLSALRAAEALHPVAFANLALDLTDRIPNEVLNEARAVAVIDKVSPSAFEQSLRDWKRHRLALTKVAVLARSEAQPAAKVMELLRWSVEDAYFDGIAIALGFGLLSPGGTHGVLKGFLSKNPANRVKGVDNAAWDLTYASHWVARTADPAVHWLFCSADHGLRELCRVALGFDTPEALLRRYWPGAEAQRLARAYEAVTEQANRSERPWQTTTETEKYAWLAKLEAMHARLTNELVG